MFCFVFLARRTRASQLFGCANYRSHVLLGYRLFIHAVRIIGVMCCAYLGYCLSVHAVRIIEVNRNRRSHVLCLSWLLSFCSCCANNRSQSKSCTVNCKLQVETPNMYLNTFMLRSLVRLITWIKNLDNHYRPEILEIKCTFLHAIR